jgi:hypothetical protein
MVIQNEIIKNFKKNKNSFFIDRGHPREKSILESELIKQQSEINLSTIFTIPDVTSHRKKLPECLEYFKENWIFGTVQEKTILRDAKKIYNAGIQDSIKKIKDAYSGIGGDEGFANYVKQLLEENMIEE